MPNRAIEFHDSQLDSIGDSKGTAIVSFSPAYVHESAGDPGWDAGSGWVQEARLHVSDAQVAGTLSEIPCDVWDGELRIDGTLLKMLPIPLEREGLVQLTLDCAANLRISGTAIKLELIGEPTYVEEFQGHTGK